MWGRVQGRRRDGDTDRIWKDLPKLLTIRAAAGLLHVHPNTLRSWEESGRLRPLRVGPRRDRRYDLETIRALSGLHALTPVEKRRATAGVLRRLAVRHWLTVGASVVAVVLIGVVNLRQHAGADTGPTVTFVPDSCIGWANGAAAQAISVSKNAQFNEFSDRNAATFDVDARGSSETTSSPRGLTCLWPPFTRGLDEHQELTGVTVKLSLAARAAADADGVLSVQTSYGGGTWTTRKTIVIRSTFSNGTNEGFFTVPLDEVTTVAQAHALQVRVLPTIPAQDEATEVRIDGISLTATLPSTRVRIDRLHPAQCGGWSNASRATATERNAFDEGTDFTDGTSAVFTRSDGSNALEVTASGDIGLTCANFPVIGSTTNDALVNATVNLSLAASGSVSSEDVVSVEYSTDDGQSWNVLDSILVRGSIDNRRHGGWWSYPLPPTLDRDQLANLRVRARFVGGEELSTVKVMIDGFTLDLTLRSTKGLERIDLGKFSFLAKRFFLPVEDPTIYIEQEELRGVEVYDPTGARIAVPLKTSTQLYGGTKRQTVQLKKEYLSTPGSYTIKLKIKSGRRLIQETQTFSWGLVSINTPKSAYRVGDTVPLVFGVVDSKGATVCDADLTVTVIDPSGAVQTLGTKLGTISASKSCGPNSITAEPDYLTKFTATQVGIYQVRAAIVTESGTESAQSTVAVTPVPTAIIERVAPSRINPQQPYLVHLFVTPKDDYEGTFTDTTPGSFVLSEIGQGGSLREEVGSKHVVWNVTWKKQKEYELTYAFDPPDISPALFTLGPAQFGQGVEARSWQVASDEVVKKDRPDLAYVPEKTIEKDWDTTAPSLTESTKTFYDGDEQAVVKVRESGFTAAGLAGPVTLTDVSVIPPSGGPVPFDRAQEDLTKNGKDLNVMYLVPNKDFAPGVYHVTAKASDGTTTKDIDTTFEWGTFDVNVAKDQYQTNARVDFSLASFDGAGKLDCGNGLSLEVQRPNGKKDRYSLGEKTINEPVGCGDAYSGKRPTAFFVPTDPGTYRVKLTRATGEVRELTKEFTVTERPKTPDDIAQEVRSAVAVAGNGHYKTNDAPTIDVEVKSAGGLFGRGSVSRAVDTVQLTDPKGKTFTFNPPSVERKQSGATIASLAIDPSYFTHPGKYTAHVIVDQGQYAEPVVQDFTWGVLAVNIRRSLERPDTATRIGMAVLDDHGVTLCDADVILEVTNPKKKRAVFTTKDGSIKPDPDCVDQGVTNNPDYETAYTTDGPGVYVMRVTANTRNGQRSIEDAFEVRDRVAFDIERTAFPTRIYPLVAYPVLFTVTPTQDYSGRVTERVPRSFAISDTTGGGITADGIAGETVISWDVVWKAGQSYTLGYTFDAPDVSPEFFRLGPLQIGNTADGTAQFSEARRWQIASDSAGIIAHSSRAYSNGFELQSTTAYVEYTANVNTPTISTSTYRSGAAALRTNPTSSTEGMEYKLASADDGANGHYFRAYVYVASAPAAKTSIMVLRSATSGADEVSIRMNTDRTLELWNDELNAQVGSASSAVALNTWTRVELGYAWLTVLAARVDGVEFAADRNLANTNYINALRLGVQTTSTSADLYWDDVAINLDGSGYENWVGDGKLAYLRPNGNGTNTAWTGDYTNVNETTPDDATGYANCTANSQLEDYDITDSATAGIGAADLVKSMSLNVRFGSSAASSHNFTGRLLLNGSNTGVTRTTSSASWFTNLAATTGGLTPITTVNDVPGTGLAPLSPADLDSTQVQLATSSCATAQARISTVWVIVEYAPAEGGRAYSSGFELQDTTAGVEWTTKDGSPTISTTTYRGGAAALRVSSLSSGTRQALDKTFKAANANGPFFARAYLNIATAPSAENRILDFRDSSGNVRAYVTMDNGRLLRLYDEDGVVGSASSALSTATWYRIELKFDASPSAGSHVVEGKIDGTTFATSSTRSISTGVTQFGVGGNMNSEAQTTGDWFFDDVAINENYGTTQNGYPGAGKIVHLRPNAAGDADTWTKNPGTCNGASNYYECVDEVTPNDATDYLSDLYGYGGGNAPFEANITSTATAGIASSDPITLVQVGIRFANSSTTQQVLSVQLRDGTGLGSNYIDSMRIVSDTTSWSTNSVTASNGYPLTAYTRPEKSSSWTATVLDSTQIGTAYLNNATAQYVSAEWLLVEYNPPAGITVSGNIYTNASNETTGFNCASTNLTIHVSVNGAANNDGTCTANPGTYSITTNTAPAAGDPVVILIDSVETEKATTVTLATDGTSAITAHLIQDRVVVQYENAGPMTNAKMATGDNADAGIRYAVSSGALTVEDGMELHVLAGKTFTPGGTVTTSVSSDGTDSVVDGDIHIPATSTLSVGTNALSVGGDFTNAGTFSKSTGHTTTFTSTGTGFTITPNANNFDSLTFNGVGGGWTMAAATGIDADLTITNGTLTAPSAANLTISGSYSNSGTFTHSNGTVIFNAGTSKTIAGTMTTTSSFNNVQFDNASGLWSINSGATAAGTFIVTTGTVAQGANTTLTVNGTAFTLASGTTWTKTSGTGKLVLDGTPSALVFTDSNTTKQNLGAVQIGASPGTTNLASDMSSDTVTIPNADTFNTKGYEVTTTGAFDCQSGCTLDLTSTGGETDGTIIDAGGDVTVNAGATFTSFTNSKVFINSTSGNRIFTTGGKAFNDVELKNTDGTNDDITISGDLDVNSALTLTDGQLRLDTNDPNITTAGNVLIDTNATVTKQDTGAPTWTFDGSGTSTWTDNTASGGQDIGLLVISGTTKTINLGSSAKATKLTVATSQTFGLGSSGYTFTLTGSGQTTSRPFQNSGSLNVGTSSTFKFTGTAATDVYDETYHHLTFAPSGAGSPTYNFGANAASGFTVNGTLTVGDATNAVTLDTNFDEPQSINDIVVANAATWNTNGVAGQSVAGNLTMNGTLTINDSIAFVATTTGHTISGSTLTTTGALTSVVFAGIGGGWTIANDAKLGWFIIQNGAVTQGPNVNLTVEGSWSTSSGTTFTKDSGSGTITFTGTTAQTFTDSTATKQNLGKVAITKTNGTPSNNKITLVSSMTADTLTVSANNTLDLTSGGYTLLVANVGSSANPLTVTGTLTATGSSTVNIAATNSGGSVNVPSTSYYNLGVGTTSDATAETYVLAGDTTVSNVLTVGNASSGASDALDGSTRTLTLSGAGTPFVLTSQGTFTGSTSTVNYTGSPSTVTVAGATYSGLGAGTTSDVTTGVTYQLGGDTTVTGVLTVGNAGSTNSDTLDGSSRTLTFSGSGTPFVVTAKGAFTSSTSTVAYTGTTATSMANGLTYSNLNVGTNDANSVTYTFPTSITTVLGDMTVATGDTFAAGARFDFGSASVATGTFTNNGTVTAWVHYYSNVAFPTGGSFTSTIWMNCSATGSQSFAPRTFGGVVQLLCYSADTITFAAGTYTFSSSFLIAELGNGLNYTVDASTNDPTINITGDLDFNGNAGITGLEILNAGAGTWTVAGNVDFNDAGGQAGQYNYETSPTANKIKMTGTTKTINTGGNALYDFEVASGGSNNVTMSANTTVNNDLTITSGKLTAPSSGTLGVGGHFTNNGTFTHNSGTVALSGASKNLTGSAAMTFNNLTISGTVTVPAGGSDVYVVATLTVPDGGTLTIGTGRIVSMTRSTGTALTPGAASTITGSGWLEYYSTDTTFPSSGTVSSNVRFNASFLGITIPDRNTGTDYGGSVECADFSGGTCTLGATANAIVIAGDLLTTANELGVILRGSTNNPAVTVTGSVTFLDNFGGVTFNMGSGVWTVGGNFDLTAVTTFTNNSGTLVMDGASRTLTTNANALNNLTLSGTVATTINGALTATGDVVLNSTISAGSLTMTGTGGKNLTGGSATLTNLTVDPGSAATVNLITSDLTVATALSVASGDSFSITGRTVTLTANTGTSLTLTGTISGSTGRLTYQNSATAFPTTGVISSIVRLDAVNGSMTVPARTGANNFGGTLELYNNSGASRNFTFGSAGSQTISVATNLDLQSTGAGSPLVVVGTNNPTMNVTGNVTASNASGTYTVNMGSGVWTVSGNFDLTNVGTLNHDSGRLTMNGTSVALTTNSKILFDLYLTNSSGTVTLPNATVTLAGDFKMSGAGATASAGSSTLIDMTGSAKVIEGGARSITGLTIRDNTTAQTSNLTVTGPLTVANSKTLTIASVNVTDSSSTEVAWGNASSTIASTGSGMLIFPTGAGGPGSTGGTLSAKVRYDATSGDMADTTIDPRTYGGIIEPYSNSTSNRTITMAAGNYILSGASSDFNPNTANATAADLIVDASTNNPTVTIGGALDFTGTGDGYEVIAAGTGTWTVSGNVDLTNGIYGPLVAVLRPTHVDTAQRWTSISVDLACGLTNIYSCLGSGTASYGATDDGGNCNGGVPTDQNFYTNRAWFEYNPTGISDSATILGTQIGATVSSTYSSAVTVTRSTTDDLASVVCTTSGGVYSKIAGSTYGTVSLNALGNKVIPLGVTGAADVQSRITGTTNRLSIGLNDSTIETTMGTLLGSANNYPSLYTTFITSGTPTLTMNGSGTTLTPAGNTLYNVNLSSTITLANETLYVAGDLNMTGGDVTPGTSTVYLTGAGKTLTAPAAGDILANVTVDPASAGTVTLAAGGGDVTVSSILNVASGDTFSIGAGRTVTLAAATGTTLTLNGTVSGGGTLVYQTSTAFPTAGTISARLRFDATGATSQIISSRTYGGATEIYNSGGTSKTVAANTGTMVFSSTLELLRADTATVTLDLNTTDPTTTTVTGALTIGAGTTLTAPSTNAFSVKGNYTNNGTFTHSSGTTTLSGTDQQTLSGSMTGTGAKFNNLTVTNAFGSDPESSPSVIFGASAETAASFTANTASTKLRFSASGTYTFQNIALNGQATATRVALRSSTPDTYWNLRVAGTQAVSNTDVRDSDACDDPDVNPDIDASDGTSLDRGHNRCWTIDTLRFSISDTGIGFGTCTPGAARYATGDTLGAASDSADAHTLSVTTNAKSGYALTVYGTTLTNGAYTISALGGAATASSPGSEQFGLRAIKNSGSGTVTSPYDTANWAFGATSVPQSVASYTGASTSYSAAYGVRYLCNIAAATEPGAYSGNLTYVLTGMF